MAVLMPRYVLCCLLFSAAAAEVEDLPEFVYRADRRGPKVVFETGFPALGNNANLLEHLSGVSCSKDEGQGTSAFVDTTASLTFAIKWGKMFDRTFEEPFYVYEIRPTKNFYDCAESLHESAKKMVRENNCYYQVYSHFMYALHVEEKRWLAYGGIPTKLIVSALTNIS